MQQRVLYALPIICICMAPCSATASAEISQENLDTCARVHHQAQQQSLTLIEQLKALKEETFSTADDQYVIIDTGIATLQRLADQPYTDYNQLVSIVTENQKQAHHLHELATYNMVTEHNRNLPYIDAQTPLAVLQEIQTATQELIDDALDRLKQTEWQALFKEGMSILNNDAFIRRASNYTAALAAITTCWVRYRTPNEINAQAPSYLKDILLLYKHALAQIGFPGNMHKQPVIYSVLDDFLSADDFKAQAKELGYRVPEERIPEDAIDLKFWKINLLDASLLTFAWNCITGNQDKHQLQYISQFIEALRNLVYEDSQE